jgi:hypothetical protein
LYDTLLKCWDADPAKRPAFPQLCDAFKEMYTVSSKSADANAARVEAATNDRLKRGEAANQYTSFDDTGDASGGGDGGAVYEVPRGGVPALVQETAMVGAEIGPIANYWMASPSNAPAASAASVLAFEEPAFEENVEESAMVGAEIGPIANYWMASPSNAPSPSAASVLAFEEPAFEEKHGAGNCLLRMHSDV